MKNLVASLGLLGIAMTLSVALCSVGLSIYGIYLAFSASIILGVLALIVEPTPLIFGLLALFGHPEVAQKIATWLGL